MSWIIWLAVLTVAALIAAAGYGAVDVPGDAFFLAFWFALSAYVGCDQFAAAVRTKGLPAGVRFSGNRRKLIQVTLAVLLLAAEALAFQTVRGVRLPAAELATTFLCCAGLLAGGEKVKTSLEGDAPGG